MNSTATVNTATPIETDREKFLAAFEKFTIARNICDQLNAELQKENLNLVQEKSGEWLLATAAEADAESVALALLEAHPEWFGTKQSFKTPHGTVQKKKSKSLVMINETVTTKLIIGQYAPEAKSLQRLLGEAADYLHIEIKPNKEALEGLSDEQLAALGIRREESETITLKPLTVDLGKAVEAKTKKPAKA